MKKNMFKKLICTALTAVCVITSVVPTFAEDVITITEAATTKSVTSAYKYHLEGYDKKGNDLFYSKKSFYKDLNSLPSIGMGKTTVNVPAVTSDVKSLTQKKDDEIYCSYLKFKAPKTGTYVCTLTNLQGTDDNAVRVLSHAYFVKVVKRGKKYGTESPDSSTVGKYDWLWENNYLEKLRTMVDAYEGEHPDYVQYLEKDYSDEEHLIKTYPTDKFKFTVKLKKGQTYIFAIDNSGMTTLGKPYYNDFYLIDQKSCLYGGQYTAAYSFDMEIKLKAKKK